MKKNLWGLALIGLSLNACFFNSDDKVVAPQATPEQKAAAQVDAQTGMNQLTQVDPMSMDANTLNSTQSHFKKALSQDPNNGMANLGLATTLIMSVQHDPEMTKNFGSNGSVSSTGKTLARVAQWNVSQTSSGLDLNENSWYKASTLQSYIESKLLPRLDSARNLLNKAIENQGNSDWRIVNQGDTLDIDKGELYVASAALNGLRASLNLACLYDWNLTDASGTMAWVDRLQQLDNLKEAAYNKSPYNWRFIDSINVQKQVVIAGVAKYNLARAGFLAWRAGKSPAVIKTDLLNAVADLEKSVAYIRTETDDQTYNPIAKSYIIEGDAEYQQNVASDTNLSKAGFSGSKIEDALARVKGIINGDAITLNNNGIDFQIRPGAFLSPGIQDLKKLLPNYTWIDESKWVTKTPYGDYDIQVIQLPNDEFTFNDPTFGGILPGMTTEKLKQITR